MHGGLSSLEAGPLRVGKAAAPTCEPASIVLQPHSSQWLPDQKGYERSPIWGVHLFKLLDAATCQKLIDLAEAHAAAHGWATGRHKHFPTTDIAVTAQKAPEIYTLLQPHVNGAVLPTLAEHFGHFDARTELSIADMFLVKYEAKPTAATGQPAAGEKQAPPPQQPQQDRLAFHRDGSLLSFSILLSDPADFDGGGLKFHSLGPFCSACDTKPCKGDACAACIGAAAAAAAVAGGNGGNGCSAADAATLAYNAAVAEAASRMCSRCQGVGRGAIPNCGRGDLTAHCGKLLHEGARVTRGIRYIMVGFVRVKSPRIDHTFVERSLYANSASRGGESDYEITEEAYDGEKGRWKSQRWGKPATKTAPR